jgi:hypothetical protein
MKDSVLRNLAYGMVEMLEEGRDMTDAYSFTKEILIGEHDGEIWNIVDAEGLEFDDVVHDIMVDIEIRAESMMEG